MKEIDFLDAVGRVDQRYVEECIKYKPPKKINMFIKSISTAAACFVMMIAVVLIVNYLNRPVIIDENGFHIEDGVLVSYTGSETDITIPEEVETIADFTFLGNQNADKIEIVRLGSGVHKVEVNAFAGLNNLVDLIIAENNLSFVYEDGLITTSDGSILLRYERENEKMFTIPESVRFVAAHAVQGTELEKIDFGENLEYIGYNSFAGNYNLKEIYLPDSVKYICEGAFSGCSSAVDGHIPDDVQFGGEAFGSVPFYLSLKAGQMSPLEEIRRGLITPSEAILQSNLESLTVQIEYILATLRGEEYEASDAAMFAYGAVHDHPEVPEGMRIPDSFTMDDLTFQDTGWGSTGIYDIQIFLPAGDYTLVMQAYGYETYEALYWKDVRFRIANLYYMQNPETVAPDDTVSAFGWTAVFGRNGEMYSGITYTHEDGRIIRSFLPAESPTPYRLTFSPDGTRVAVEYTNGSNPAFYVQALNGDVLMEPYYDYNEYLNRYYGQYKAGTLTWADEDNIEGENEFGRFRFNIYEFHVTQFDDGNTAETSRFIGKYRARFEIPKIWSETEDGYADTVRRNREVNEIRVQITTNVRREDREADDSEFRTNDKGCAYRMTEEVPADETIRSICHFAFKYEKNFAFDWIFTIYRDDDKDYLENVILPIVNSISIEPDVTIVGVDHTGFRDLVNSMGENNAFPPYSYSFGIYGFSTYVSFSMREYDIPGALSAFGQTVEIDKSVHFYGNCSVNLFEYNGAVIFTWDYYDIGYTYIIGSDFTEIIEPGDTSAIKLYLNEAGELCYKRTNNKIADIIQTGGLSAASGYDDFLYCVGSASIENGGLVLGDAEEYYTIGDKYDLDKEFAENGYSHYYDSIEEVFEKNQHLPNGDQLSTPTVVNLLSMTVSELRSTYSALKFEYSEHGPGQPVYSMENFPGVMIVFHSWDMNDPLTDDMIPDELIITEDYDRAIHGLKVGLNVEDGTQTVIFLNAEYSVMNGTVSLQAENDKYTVTYVVSGEYLNYPTEDKATEADWDQREGEYLLNPTGKILQIRIELK